MHLYVVAKGIKPHIEKWQNDLLAQYVPMFKDGKPYFSMGADGQPKQENVQISVRPIQLFEIGFPKEALELVMANVGTGGYILERYPKLNKIAKYLRKFLGLKEVPIPKKVNPLMQPNQQEKAVAVVPIGIKEDDMSPTKGFEML